jgi:hypothetical protein
MVAVLRAADRDSDAERWAREGLGEYSFSDMSDELRDQLTDLLLDNGRGLRSSDSSPMRSPRTVPQSS